MEEFDCKKCLHEKVCALWASRESQNASCFCTDGCDYFTPTLTPPNGWVSVEEMLPPEHEPVLCIVNGKPKPNITLERRISLDHGIKLTAGSLMNTWTGKMLMSRGGCPFRSRRERRQA